MFHVKLFVAFLCYSFAGWLWEECLCFVEEGKLVNRGFLNGPILPIYGVGALVIYGILTNETLSLIPLFCTGATVAVTLEYFTSLIMEIVFHARWWDYTDRKCNLDGRICIEGFIVFGIFGVIEVSYVHPWLISKISAIDEMTLLVGALVTFMLFVCDVVISTLHALKIKERLDHIHKELEAFKESHVFEDIEMVFEYYLEHPEYCRGDLKEFNQLVLSYQFHRMLDAFPRMKIMVEEHQEIFEDIRVYKMKIRERRKEIKQKNKG
ncbi:MAG: putative ABC transporter permease [Erysipelotrichaceae bacterium]|nr:putative ABC transporter permease [Erysipelotrichaceae bacterium]